METYNWEKPDDIYSAILTLYAAQTQEEQLEGQTVERNGVGFNSADAEYMSSLANQIQSKGWLSPKQVAIAKTVLPKYAKQLGGLQRSITVATVASATFIPVPKPKRNNGRVDIQGDDLIFTPNIYPSVQAKDLGLRWNSKDKSWHGRASSSTISGLELMFGDLEITEEAAHFVEAFNTPVTLSPVVHDSSLFDFQKEATEFMIKTRRSLLGLAPGLGKTASSIFAANEVKCESILVVCPLSLVRNWRNEIKKWIGKPATIWHGKIENWEPYDKWVITNYETFTRNLDDIIAQEFDVAIIDESILVKNRKAKRTEACEKFGKTTKFMWLLSGSPTSKFLDDMWSQLHIIDPRRFSSYWRFVDQYCVKEVNQWGTAVVNNQDDAIVRLKRDLADVYFCRTQAEVLNIPDWIFSTVEVPMSKAQFKYYEEMELEFLANLPSGDVVLAPNMLSQMIRLRQFASNPVLLEGADDGCKWKATEEMLEFEEFPVIIWTEFIHTADLMVERLGRKYRVRRLTGSTPSDERQDIVDAFQNGEVDILVAHPAVGKFGLTLTKARTAIYMERSFNGDDFYQSLYRIKRIGTTQSPHVICMVATRPDGDELTIDGVVDRVLSFRKDSSIAITSGLIGQLLGKSQPVEN